MNRAPVSGTSPRLVRCSAIGIPAARSAEWAGRAVSARSRVDGDDRRARRDQPLRRGAGQERRGSAVRLGPPVPVVARPDQDRHPSERDALEHTGIDRGSQLPRVDPHRRHVHEPIQRQTGQVRPVRQPVERAVHVGPGVPAQRHHVDLERDTRRVRGLARLAVQERVGLGHGQARVRGHPGLDRVAEVDQAVGGHRRHPPSGGTEPYASSGGRTERNARNRSRS